MSCFQNALKSHKSLVKKYRHIRTSPVTMSITCLQNSASAMNLFS